MTGLCILPRARDDLEDLGPDGVPVPAVLLPELTEAGGVEVEPLHADPDLVTREPGVGVQPPRGLREHPDGLEHAVQPDG